MKSTLLKISVSQDGLLPQETAEIATLEFPTLPKKLLKALGFERVDAKTYVGVLPVFINLGEKEQEIEIELGVTLPEMRKKIIEIVKTPARLIAVANEKKAAAPKEVTAKVKEEIVTAKKTPVKKAPAAIKKGAAIKKPAAIKKAAAIKKPAAKKASPVKPKAAPKTAAKTKKTAVKTTTKKAPAAKTTATKAKKAKKG